MPFATNVVPENLQWLGIAKEATAGTAVAPVLSMPFDKIGPDNKPVMLVDKGIRGAMAEDYGDIQGVEIADFPASGNVHLDAIGHFLLNAWGDYQATGTSPTSATTVAASTAAGATSFTVGAIGSIVIGSVLQFGNATLGTAPTENLLVSNVAGSVVTFATTPTRFAHGTNAAVAIVTAPFSHIFSLLNSGNGQPPTHTLMHHDQLAAAQFARQYAFWCCSGIDFKMNAEQLFQHDTKGTAVVGVIPGSAPTNTQSGIVAVPNWEFKVGIGGPASGGTLVSNIEDATVSIARALKPKFTLQSAQTPWVIARLGMSVTGKFTFMAQDESPLLALLANTQQQLQIAMTQGAGVNTLGITFNHQLAAYEVATIQAPDTLTYDVSWRALANTTDAGFSGGYSPSKITLVNAVPTY
jgi:hypothetical protein